MDFHERLEQAVIHAVANLLDTMIPIPFRRGEDGDGGDGNAFLLGTINVNGRMNGSISVSMPAPMAMDMASLMLEEELEEITDDVYETVAEMTNIIAGGIKTFLCQQEEIFQLGLPQVLELARFDASGDSHRLAIPIQTDKGCFVVLSSLYESAADGE
ncbi:MAG: chemotaxis protein CheX [Candidatus Sericytochromatia bacterium]